MAMPGIAIDLMPFPLARASYLASPVLNLDSLRRSREDFLQPVGNPHTERQDRQGRIRAGARREHRATSNVQILDSMHLALGIYDAMPRSLMHSSSPHLIRCIMRPLDPRRGVIKEFNLLQIE